MKYTLVNLTTEIIQSILSSKNGIKLKVSKGKVAGKPQNVWKLTFFRITRQRKGVKKFSCNESTTQFVRCSKSSAEGRFMPLNDHTRRMWPGVEAHACNPRYFGGRHLEVCSSRPSPGKS
jgi:hypothetical protein